ncbi:MAG: GNAT family protein [Solirubrobacteraceae bacterium]
MRLALPEPLTDGRVTLRWMRVDDAPACAAAFRDDPDLGRLIGVERDPDETSIRERIAGQEERAAEGRGMQLAIADAESDAFWGSMILHSFDWHSRRAEIGFWLIPSVRGRGVGVAAVALAVSWAFAQLDLLRLEMTTTPENPAVPALARRLGFTQEGVLRARTIERGQRVDIIWFGLLREEWPAGDAE